MTPDPAFLYLTPQHREALAGLTYAILAQKGFLVLTGDAGTGKTTLLARVLQRLPTTRIRTSVILNPTLTASEFLEMTLLDFGITEVPVSKAQRLTKLQQLLTQADRQSQISALIIDEAHKLRPDVLEEIRLLGNFEQSDHKLLQIVFLGQNELGDLLNRPDLRQLKQRIAARFNLRPLAASEVEQYIQYRWTKAGGDPKLPFTAQSIESIAAYSRGIPRVINAICDNALLQAFAEETAVVAPHHVLEACTALDLLVEPQPLQSVGNPEPEPEPEQNPDPVYQAELPSLNRYTDTAVRQSFFSKWAGKLGLAN